MMASLRDGLGFDVVTQSGLAGPASNHAYFVGSVTAAAGFINSAGTNLSNTNGIGAGSPVGYGWTLQAGSAIASNVAVAVQFPVAFLAAPISIVVTEQISGAQATTAGCVVTGATAGSFLLLGTSGAPYSWLAIGSL